MSRKNLLNLVPVDATRPTKTPSRPLLSPSMPSDQPAADNKLVKQVGSSIREEKARQARADEIERRLAEGQAVIELDPAEVEPSFIQDRMPGEIEALIASIKENGQQVPILVRPHPDLPGRYQVAFGHRRLRAVQALSLPVKAVVRDLTDEQLVVAQGQENNERQDLTYIEKALFADNLQQRFSREVIMSALSVYKSDLSYMLSVVVRIPRDVINAIGPAPGVGRRSWVELADLLGSDGSLEMARSFLDSTQAKALPSEARFKAVASRLKPHPVSVAPDVWTAGNGTRLAKVLNTSGKLEIAIDRKEAPEFAALVLKTLEALYHEHRSKK
ncbi:plasmid partitioning protein RepB [Xaviernesmea oryzae]|uniref:Chromosome partitioning protein, ParB family n=1 Tax=Xaviernesmea oryzae TaxID=464029 RepID=A0A1X7FXE6_9HYPH|nr:plasmid partitioning protein RepB [Xaviernesmea oryzae]SMF60496.1 chromosome partitioning protein, ParB family [Xaviernesmea oryzae]